MVLLTAARAPRIRSQVQRNFAGAGFRRCRNYIFAAAAEPMPAMPFPAGGEIFPVVLANWPERLAAMGFVEASGDGHTADMSGRAPIDEPNAPATLFRVMQDAIADGLRERYDPPQKMSHQLFVLMMQMNDRARRERAQAEQAAQNAATAARPDVAGTPPMRKTKAAKRAEPAHAC